MSALRKYHIPLPGALLALLAFFLPWMSVGCQGLFSVDVSGFDLAANRLFNDAAGLLGAAADAPVDTTVFTILWLIPAAAVLSVALVLVTMRRPDNESRTGVGHLLAGLLGFAGLLVVWLQLRGSLGEVGDTGLGLSELVEMKYGLWLTVAGLLIIIVGGVLSFLAGRRAPAPYQQPATIGGMTQMTASSGPVIGGLPPGGVVGGAMPSVAAGASTLDYGAPITAYDAPSVRRATEVLNRAEPANLGWLVVKDGPRAGHSFRLQEQTNIGGDAGNDIILDDSALSGQHARVKVEDGHFILYDLASTNGVFVYDDEKQAWQRIYRQEMVDGQQIRLGRTELHFMAPTAAESK